MMNAIDTLKYGHATVLQAVKDLPEAEWHTPGVCGHWSVKDIMAHLASFEQMLVELLASLAGDEGPHPTLTRFIEDYEGFNDGEVHRLREKSVAEIWAKYDEAQAQAAHLLADIPPETRRQNGLLAWYGAAYDLEDFIVYTFYGHKREHCAQIAVFRDGLATATATGISAAGDPG